MIVRLKWCFFLLLLPQLMGCVSFHMPTSSPPVYYQLDYDSPGVNCPHPYKKGLRVWRFTATSPYRRTEMVVLKPEGQVLFSSGFQWVTNPGTLVSESLLRDLATSRLFPQVVSANDPTRVPLELSGHVFVFAWERNGKTSYAVLQVELSLIDTDSPGQVIFRKEYSLKSLPFAEDNSAAFARAMSYLMQKLSEKFQQDLCLALRQNKQMLRQPKL